MTTEQIVLAVLAVMWGIVSTAGWRWMDSIAMKQKEGDAIKADLIKRVAIIETTCHGHHANPPPPLDTRLIVVEQKVGTIEDIRKELHEMRSDLRDVGRNVDKVTQLVEMLRGGSFGNPRTGG